MELNSPIQFSQAQFNKLFPFYIEINSDLKISTLGISLRKIIGGQSVGLSFLDLFTVERPRLDNTTWQDLITSCDNLIILKYIDKSILFRGQFEYLEARHCLLFIGSPWINSIDNLKDNDLLITDFAAHDPTFDLLHIIKNVEINSDEIKILLKKLKEKSEIIKQSETSYKATLNMASEIIFRTNNKGYFTYVNRAAEKLIGVSEEELLKMNYTDLIHPDYISATKQKYLNQIKNKEESTYFEFPIITKNGEEKWIGQSVQFIKNQGYFEFVALAIDITKQKIMNLNWLKVTNA